MITEQEAKRLARKNLSPKRYEHTLNVCKLAKELARRGGIDVKKAALAALLHDLAKEMPRQELLQIFAENVIMSQDVLSRPMPVWHGVAASILAQTQYGVDDADILSAVACHTTGKANMTVLDKIIYIADMASEERTYPEAAALRKAALTNLEQATLQGLGMSINWLKDEGKPVDKATLEAYASLRKTTYGG